VNGEYRSAIRMCIFQPQFLAKYKTKPVQVKPESLIGASAV
jgi:diamine N-acetyltransferase